MKVSILSYIADGEEIIARCGNSTSSETPPSEYQITKEDARKFIKTAKKMRLSSVFDFPYIVYSLEDVSRSLTHQHVRHRIAAQMQQSFRYVKLSPKINEEPWFVIPPDMIEHGNETVVDYIHNQLETAETYNRLVERGVKPENARFALPIGTKTFVSTAMDPESLLHYIDVRTCYDAQWEIRAAANALRTGMRFVYPNIFEGSGPSCFTSNVCIGRGKMACKKDVVELTGKLEDVVAKNREEFDGLEVNEKLRLDLTEHIGYKADRELEEEVGKEFGLDRINLGHEVKLEVAKRSCWLR